MSALEPRVLLAGDAGQAVEAGPSTHGESPLSFIDVSKQIGATGQARSQLSSPSEIVFIDSRVDDIDMLTSGLNADAEFVLIDSRHDAIDQISELLSHRKDVRSLHIVSHATSGKLMLGSRAVDVTQLNQNQQAISGWSRSLLPGADIIVYGCEAGAGPRGESFARRLAQLSGQDVAFSIDRTGNGESADWEFELTVGSVESPIAFSLLTRQHYSSTLALENMVPTKVLRSSEVDENDLISARRNEQADKVKKSLPDNLAKRTRDEVSVEDPSNDVVGDSPISAIATIALVDQTFVELEPQLPGRIEPMPAIADVGLIEVADEPPAELVPAQQLPATPFSVPPVVAVETPGPRPILVEDAIPMENGRTSFSISDRIRPTTLPSSMSTVKSSRGIGHSILVTSMFVNSPSADRDVVDRGTLDLTEPASRDRIRPRGVDASRTSIEPTTVPLVKSSSSVRSANVIVKAVQASSRLRIVDSSVIADSVLTHEKSADAIATAKLDVLESQQRDDSELDHGSSAVTQIHVVTGDGDGEKLSSRSGAYQAWAEQQGNRFSGTYHSEQFESTDGSLQLSSEDARHLLLQGHDATIDAGSGTSIHLSHGSGRFRQLESLVPAGQDNVAPSAARLARVNNVPIAITVHSIGYDARTPDSSDDGQGATLICDKSLDAGARLLDAFAQPQRFVCHSSDLSSGQVQPSTSYLNPLRQYQASY